MNRDGERDPTPVAVDWTVDTITAHLIWEAGPNFRTRRDPVTIAGQPSRGRDVRVPRRWGAFHRVQQSVHRLGQPEGAYRLIVRAVNRGLIGPARTLDWIVDGRRPTPSCARSVLSSGMTTSRGEIAYEVRVLDFAMEDLDGEVDPESSFEECRLDGGPWTWCTALGNPLENLVDGAHGPRGARDGLLPGTSTRRRRG